MEEVEKVEFISYDELEKRYYNSNFSQFRFFRKNHNVSIWSVYFSRKIKFTTFKED